MLNPILFLFTLTGCGDDSSTEEEYTDTETYYGCLVRDWNICLDFKTMDSWEETEIQGYCDYIGGSENVATEFLTPDGCDVEFYQGRCVVSLQGETGYHVAYVWYHNNWDSSDAEADCYAYWGGTAYESF